MDFLPYISGSIEKQKSEGTSKDLTLHYILWNFGIAVTASITG